MKELPSVPAAAAKTTAKAASKEDRLVCVCTHQYITGIAEFKTISLLIQHFYRCESVCV